MTWVDHMNISEYDIAGSTYGGPIGESVRNDMTLLKLRYLERKFGG